jgi:hypothetical protein
LKPSAFQTDDITIEKPVAHPPRSTCGIIVAFPTSKPGTNPDWCWAATRIIIADPMIAGARGDVHMVDTVKRARLLRELEQEFVPDYDAQNMPSVDKRSAYALEYIAFRVGRLERSLARIAAALEAVLAKQ